MAIQYTLLMQKEATGSDVKSSLHDFGFAVCAIEWPDDETQEPATRVWPGRHGEDTYIPADGLKLQAYDLTVEFCYKGEPYAAFPAYKALRDYMIGTGGFLSIYDPFWRIGRQKLYLKKLGDLEPHRNNADELLTAKATLRVTDPVTDKTLSYVGD